MSTNVLILGESGTGKSTAIRTLESKETFLIRVIEKPLPFRGWKNLYRQATADDPNGNMVVQDKSNVITATLKWISNKRPDIKTIIVDDFQYIMANEFMRRHSETGYTKFTQMGFGIWDLIMQSSQLREDLTIFFLAHTDRDETGKTKCKTIGKMLDEKITLEGLFTIVLETVVQNGQYMFLTRNNGHNTVKSPMDMFQTETIENDLRLVATAIKEY